MPEFTSPAMQATDALQSRDQIIAALVSLFRCAGFDGVSINDISAATGLGRSSLYHHFPGGKEDMAGAVIAFAKTWMQAHILDPLGADRPLEERVDAMLVGIDQLYDGGAKPCLIASMLVGHREDLLGRSLAAILETWVDELAKALTETGTPAQQARQRALSAIVQVQGALVLASAIGDKALFPRTLREVRSLLLDETRRGE